MSYQEQRERVRHHYRVMPRLRLHANISTGQWLDAGLSVAELAELFTTLADVEQELQHVDTGFNHARHHLDLSIRELVESWVAPTNTWVAAARIRHLAAELRDQCVAGLALHVHAMHSWDRTRVELEAELNKIRPALDEED